MNSILEDFKQAFRTGNILNQLIVINVVVFIIFGVLGVFLQLSGAGDFLASVYNYLALPSNPDDIFYQPLSFITYMFMHSGLFHILWNMLFLYWFGKLITQYLGQNKLLGLHALPVGVRLLDHLEAQFAQGLGHQGCVVLGVGERRE